MDELKSCKHRAIEDKLDVLTTGIAGQSTPDIFGGHLVGSGFVDSECLDEVLQVHGDGPRRKVQRLLNAVVTAIKTASSPKGSDERFDSFMCIIIEHLQLHDLGQQVLDRCADLDKLVHSHSEQPCNTNSVDDVETCQYLTEHQARKRRKHLRRAFTSLVIRTKKHLINTKANLDVFRDEFILYLSTPVKKEHMKFFAERSAEIVQASSFNELFYCLNLYWDYLNYNLLESIIEQLENPELEEGMMRFSNEVNEFRKTTQLKVFCKIEPFIQVKAPDDFKIVVAEHSITSQSTLQTLENIRIAVTKHFNLPMFALTLAKVVPGSVIVTWVMPRSVVELLLCGLTAELMDELHIVSMKIVEDASTVKCKPVSIAAPQELEIVNAAALGNTARVEELVGKDKENLRATDKNGMTALMRAAGNGHTDTVESLVAAGAELNTLNEHGCTAVMFAVADGHFDCVEVLVEAGADLDIEDQDGWTALIWAASCDRTDVILTLEEAGCTWPPLAYAAYHGQTDRAVELFQAAGRKKEDGFTALVLAAATGNTGLVKSLKAVGADINFTTKSNWTALMRTSHNGHTESQKVLLEAGADFNIQAKNGVTALMWASHNGHTESQKVLLEAGADFNLRDEVGVTALMMASLNGHTESQKVLLEAGADFNIQAKNDVTALMLASREGHTESQKVLLEAGADFNLGDENGGTALMMASHNGHTESQKVLLEAGADFNIQAKNGGTALMMASHNGHTESQKVLLEAGADFNIQAKNGVTALMMASHNGHTESQKVLLEAGADFNIQAKNGMTALMWASHDGHTESQKVLLEAGAGFNLQDENGGTALMMASLNGHTRSLEVLLEAGADFTIQMKDGQTALTIAMDMGHTECVKCLIEVGATPPDVLNRIAQWGLQKLSGWVKSLGSTFGNH